MEFSSILLFLLILPNLALIMGHRIAGASHSWSIGIEEQFYLIWPWLVGKIHPKKIPLALTVLISVKVIFLNNLSLIFAGSQDANIIFLFVENFSIEYMAMGALAGYIYTYINDHILFNKKELLMLIFVCLSGALFFLGSKTFLRSIVFSGAILLSTKFKIHNIWIKDVGQKSYGIYMYHPTIIYISSATINYFNYDLSSTLVNLGFYFMVISLTLLISHYSFKYFETPIRKKILFNFRK